MANGFWMQLEDRIQPDKLLSLVNRVSGISYANKNLLKDDLSRLSVGAYLEDDKYDIKYVEEKYGFTPFVVLGITPGKFEPERSDELLLSIAVGVLQELEGDIVLDYDSPLVLKRIDGKITFNSEWDDMSGINILEQSGLVYDVAKLIPE